MRKQEKKGEITRLVFGLMESYGAGTMFEAATLTPRESTAGTRSMGKRCAKKKAEISRLVSGFLESLFGGCLALMTCFAQFAHTLACRPRQRH